MPDQSPRIELPYLQPSQAQKHVTHNEALQRLDMVVQLAVQGFAAVTPPALPADGDTYALGSAAQGAWAGQDGQLAYWNGEAWIFSAPQDGWRAWDIGGQALKVYHGGDWHPAITTLNDLDELGIATQADAVNRLAVASPASLFTHAGAGHQLKINKAQASDTASLLFQSGWAGHAEMGLAGDNNWSLKVSPDGSSWHVAMSVDPGAGEISMAPAGTERMLLSDTALQVDVPLTGSAVQSNALDETAGRMMAVGAFGLGATDSGATKVADGRLLTGSGFYSGSGSSADIGTFPNSAARYNPFIIANRRNGSGSWTTVRIYFDGTVPVVGRSVNMGASWDAYNTLFGTENLLGAVSQTGGTPTGAVLERGANANGEYLRLADGTQICWNGNSAITIAPAAFAGTITKIDSDKLWIGRWF